MGGVRAEDEEKMRTARLGDVGGPEEEKREREEAWRKCGLGVDGGEGVLRVSPDHEVSATRSAR